MCAERERLDHILQDGPSSHTRRARLADIPYAPDTKSAAKTVIDPIRLRSGANMTLLPHGLTNSVSQHRKTPHLNLIEAMRRKNFSGESTRWNRQETGSAS
jgi:hypothetical protein